ncbi:unnamed protein product (macronuclear) [Paramecium tetraurelia]|uniref:Complex 1 LYR protein domain-containing protein n=1 Tax=Paramecium tetraurelia TaxID=5888 RepID=A0D9L7_PARTE|nr:uncharacterized protein GSPATT00014664001 [Paramecium tetraurelia]CAK79734.1 unnamed protein product [Paramecium tetraurelia]|eukprot:XP_001447131.1 hypothetical protein (macronuclear) [Paramecium tetraurelia strain d4-2]
MDKSVLKLYKQILRAGNQFKDYNFREYVIRRAKQDFRELQINPDLKNKVFEKYTTELEVIKRQAIVQNLYYQTNHIIEQKQCNI